MISHPSSFIKRSFLFILGIFCFFFLFTLSTSAQQASSCSLTIGSPYRAPSVSTVYVITDDCQKRPIFNPDVYFSHFDSWSRVVFVESYQLDAVSDHPLRFLPWGPLRTFQNGSLIKITSDPKVYLLVDGKAYPIEDEASFGSLGYSFNQIEDVTEDVLNSYTKQTSSIRSVSDLPASFVFKYENDPAVYVLRNIDGELVKLHVTTMEQVRNIVRADRLAVLPANWTFGDSTATEEEDDDTTNPTVSFTSPASGATISGTATLQASASDNVAVASVRFSIGSTTIATDTSSPYSASLNTASYSNGSYTLTALATDTSGNTASVTRQVTIANEAEPEADTANPTVSFTSPSDGAAISDTVTIQASASDNVAVASVRFSIGSTTIATDTSSPYSASLNTASYSNGSYTLTALATDTSGNTATVTRSVTITNTSGGAGGDLEPGEPLSNDASVAFLHHSTGGVIWNQGMVQQFTDYNAANGTNYSAENFAFPKSSPYGWNNYPYDYWNIWVQNAGSEPYLEEPTLEILAPQYDVIVLKHCFPVSAVLGDPGVPDIASMQKSHANYVLQYNALRDKMREFPDTRFIVWTFPALVETATNVDDATRARDFTDWVKQTWDEPGDNIFLFDFRQLETGGGLYLTPENAASANDSHPNETFGAATAPLFAQRIIDVIEGRGDTGSLTGE